MSGNGFAKLKEIRNLNNHIDRIYEHKETLMNNALKEINMAYGHLLEEDSEDECAGLQQPKQSIAAAKKPSRVSRKKEPPIAPSKITNTTVTLRKSTRNSTSHYQSAINSTCYLDAVGENAEEVKNHPKITPLKTQLDNQVDDEKVNTPPPHVPKNRIGLLNDVTVSKPKVDVSYIKSSIATLDIINPIGSSTPERNTTSSPNSADEMTEKPNSHYPDDLVVKPNNLDVKSEHEFVKPNLKILSLKNTFAKLKTTKFEDAQNKKMVRMNEMVEAKKRKREERTQKVAAHLAKAAEAREKRQVVLKYEKQKEDEKSKMLKQKEIKSKNTQKKTEIKEQLKIKKDDILEYKLDHIVDGASSEDEETPKNQVPRWATEEMREHPANVQAWLDKNETVYKWFFDERLKTPVLEELFSTGVRMRTRTSSAVWHR